jgi:hypothetical protein
MLFQAFLCYYSYGAYSSQNVHTDTAYKCYSLFNVLFLALEGGGWTQFAPIHPSPANPPISLWR